MRFPLLRPRWIGLHLVAVLVAATCFALGYWQFTRSQEPSQETVTNPAQDLAQATKLEQVLEPGAYLPQDDANRAVTATGSYDADAQLLTPAKSEEGKKGYYVIVPLVTKNDTALAVNRGWVPKGTDSPDNLAPLPKGDVTVTGWLQPPQKDEDNRQPVSVPKGQVARISPSMLVNEWSYQLYDGYVSVGDQDPADLQAHGEQSPQRVAPPEPPTETTWNWKNLSYAAQWGVFGIAAIVFWISLMRRELHEHADGGGELAGNASPGDGNETPDSQPSAAETS